MFHNGPQVVVIGCSAGGIHALATILSLLSDNLQTPIVVAQHMFPQSLSRFQTIFANNTKKRIFDCEDKTPLCSGSIYFAPPNYHLLFEDKQTLGLSVDEAVNFARPSIDVLFESAAKVFNQNVIGMLLTGASSDGARGLKMIHRKGGHTFVQDPDSAEHGVMPASAIKLFHPSFVGSLEKLAQKLNETCVPTQVAKSC